MFFPRAHAGGLLPPLHPLPGGKAPGTPGRFAPVRHPGSIHESLWLDYNVLWPEILGPYGARNTGAVRQANDRASDRRATNDNNC